VELGDQCWAWSIWYILQLVFDPQLPPVAVPTLPLDHDASSR
jgi:hypothetical protein